MRLFSVNLGAGGGGVLVARSGEQAITNGASTVSAVFSTDIGTTNYSVMFEIVDISDSDPIFLQGIVTTKATSGFTITFNAPVDSANYVMTYMAAVFV